MENNPDNSSFSTYSSYLKYLPFILGALGLAFLILGIYFTVNSPGGGQEITITDSLKPEASSPAFLLVDVEGAVVKPGVYEVLAEGRIREALMAAGGLSEEADREWTAKNLNLAAKLVDGSKIYIPKAGETSNKQEATSNKTGEIAGILSALGLININSSSMAELDTLPGVGEVTAQKIIDGRPYEKIEDLIDKKIVNNGVWEKIKEKISVY